MSLPYIENTDTLMYNNLVVNSVLSDHLSLTCTHTG